MNSAEKTVMAYMEQAAIELVGDTTFSSEIAFKEWISNNFEAVVQKAKQLQATTVEKLLDSSNPATKAVKNIIAVKVHADVNKAKIQSVANARIQTILRYDDEL